MARRIVHHPIAVFGKRWNVRVVDGTQVNEPGPTGSSWRIHYAVGLPSLRCTAVEVTDGKGAGNGETFARFPVRPGDLFLGDRAYGLPRAALSELSVGQSGPLRLAARSHACRNRWIGGAISSLIARGGGLP